MVELNKVTMATIMKKNQVKLITLIGSNGTLGKSEKGDPWKKNERSI